MANSATYQLGVDLAIRHCDVDIIIITINR